MLVQTLPDLGAAAGCDAVVTAGDRDLVGQVLMVATRFDPRRGKPTMMLAIDTADGIAQVPVGSITDVTIVRYPCPCCRGDQLRGDGMLHARQEPSLTWFEPTVKIGETVSNAK